MVRYVRNVWDEATVLVRICAGYVWIRVDFLSFVPYDDTTGLVSGLLAAVFQAAAFFVVINKEWEPPLP